MGESRVTVKGLEWRVFESCLSEVALSTSGSSTVLDLGTVTMIYLLVYSHDD